MTSGMRCTAIAVLAMALAGCRPFGGKVKPDPPPLPPPLVPVAKAPPPKVEPPGPPPKIETKTPEVPTAVATLPKPPAPRPKRRTPKKTVPATAGAAAANAATLPQSGPPKDSAPPVEPAVTPAPAVPRLGEVYSDDQRSRLLKSCDESMAYANEALRQLRALNLTPEQKQTFTRIKVFIGQAQQARTRDPQTAKQLAERAESLSRDLLRTVR